MKYQDSHISDQDLLLDVDGELSAYDGKLVRAHLDTCWKCRARRHDLENAITDLIRIHPRELDLKLPPIAGPRALLKVRLARLCTTEGNQSPKWFTVPYRRAWTLAAFACTVLAVGLYFAHPNGGRQYLSRSTVVVSFPDPTLTPGAALLEDRQAVCAQANPKNKEVSAALQRKVFQEYGIAGAEPRAYEVDYLITPALGGADDIHNLWPHSYSATVWNAEVKDALEDRLRVMVCDGNLDLVEAQKEIAENWIAAYKKYFHTETPIATHP